MFMDDRRVYSGSAPHGTNNRAELNAAILALEKANLSQNVRIFSDSTYVVTPWKDIKPFLEKVQINRDLWLKLYELTEGRNVTFHWLPRNSTPELKACDSIAKLATL